MSTVLVTGATGGIGSHTCRALAAKGIRPVVGFRSDKAAAEVLADELGGIALKLDLADPASIAAAMQPLAAEPLTGVAHCASPPPLPAPFGRIPAEDMQRFWNVNVLGPQLLLAGLVKHCFRKNKSGIVVAVTSKGMGENMQGAMPGLGAYTVSKYGLCGVLALLAAEHPWLVVKTVKPGFTRTKMLDAFDPRFIEQIEYIAEPELVAQEIAACFQR